MNIIISLITATLLLLVLSFGFGMITGDSKNGWRMVKWELRQLNRFGRWILGHTFQTLSDLFKYLATQCATKKKKTP